jgi:hypothetical protein
MRHSNNQSSGNVGSSTMRNINQRLFFDGASARVLPRLNVGAVQMSVRQWIGDLAFAVLLTLPLAAFAPAAPIHSVAATERTSVLGS